MEDYAALISGCTALRAAVFPLTDRGVAAVAAQVTALRERVAVVFVTGLRSAESMDVQAEVIAAEGPLVVTELDLVTAALAAATVATLHARRLRPGLGRVMVTGVDGAPHLGRVLSGLGVGTVTSFHQRTTSTFPLRQLMSHHDVLIDLTGTVSPLEAPCRILSLPTEPFDLAALALPGLLSALRGHECPVLTVDALTAAARAIALVTPGDRSLPDPHDQQLTSAVAQQVSRTLSASAG